MSLVEFEFLIDGAACKIGVEDRGQTFVFKEGEAVLEAEVRRVSANELLFGFAGRTARVHLARDGERTLVSVAGREFVISEPEPGTGRSLVGDERTPEGSLWVKAPMPGKVIKLCVQEGEEVRRNQTLVIVEAMKMENEIQSPVEGIVKKVHAAVGELVDSEKPLVEIEPKT
jgi:biotin carboxyl carrier protein